MSNSNKRQHPRVNHQASIRIDLSTGESYTWLMRDFSESGLYVFCQQTDLITIDDKIKVQTLEMEDAPIIDARVVRVDEGKGFAVKFITK